MLGLNLDFIIGKQSMDRIQYVEVRRRLEAKSIYNGEPQLWLRSGACCCHISLGAKFLACKPWPLQWSAHHFGSLNKIIHVDPTICIFN